MCLKKGDVQFALLRRILLSRTVHEHLDLGLLRKVELVDHKVYVLDLGTQIGQLVKLTLEGALAMLEEVLHLGLVLQAEGFQHCFGVDLREVACLGS